ncbi:MAG: hypothetical protein K2L81_01755, partial [Muribaculaceae bacterium]|nr:hypothetical protein [Muribaculaceae bacterium]
MAFAQKVDKKEVKQLQAFLAQTSEKGGTNAQALNISDLNSPATWEGVTVADGHVTAIEWKDKKLGGDLALTGFTALTKVDVSRNALKSLNVSGDAALVDLNASRNKLTNINTTGCAALENLSVYHNRLSELEITDTPVLKNLNCSNNYFV